MAAMAVPARLHRAAAVVVVQVAILATVVREAARQEVTLGRAEAVVAVRAAVATT